MAVPGTVWSNSALLTVEQCGEKYRRRYIERDIFPPSPRMLRGTVVHRAASRSLLQKMETEELPSTEEVMDLAASDFDRTWRDGVLMSLEERQEGAGAVRDRSMDFAVDLSGFHVQKVAPSIRPIGVERKIVVAPNDSDLEISGTIDLIDQTPTGEVIRDLKTSEKSPPPSTAETSQQLTMYGLLRVAEVGRIPEKFSLDYLVRTPVKNEKKHVVLDTTRDRSDLQALINRINMAVEAVKRGVFMPAPPDAWYCSPTWCEYYDTCPYTNLGVRRPTS
jgi:hypothetical protein